MKRYERLVRSDTCLERIEEKWAIQKKELNKKKQLNKRRRNDGSRKKMRKKITIPILQTNVVRLHLEQ